MIYSYIKDSVFTQVKGMQSSKQGKSAIFSGKYVPSSTEENENLSMRSHCTA